MKSMMYRRFRTLLIANRGEIACRVIRTARAMGLRTVAVYSEADRDALHVAMADSAVLLGPARARDSYLNIDAVIEAARKTGAEAIHPGYGFLSENAEFAAACAKAGIVFVGPTAEMMTAMGSKSGSKALMEKAGMSGPALNQFESWAVAVTLASGLLKDLDVSPDYGVEKQLQATFAKSKKPVSGLETTELQLGLFDKLPESAQRAFLSSMVDDSVDPAKEFNDMVSAWSKGDDTAIAASFDDEFKRSPELAQSLLYNRNANWKTWVEKRLKQPGTVFVAVGAGHLAGPDSVVAMLAKEKVKVERIQ